MAAHGALPGPDEEPRVSVSTLATSAASQRPRCSPTAEPVLEVTDSEALTWFDVADTMSKALGRPITHYPTPPDVIRQVMLGMGRPAWLVEHMLKLAAFLREPKAAEVTTPWGESPAGQPPPWASSSPTSRPPSLRPLKTIALDSRHARSAETTRSGPHALLHR